MLCSRLLTKLPTRNHINTAISQFQAICGYNAISWQARTYESFKGSRPESICSSRPPIQLIWLSSQCKYCTAGAANVVNGSESTKQSNPSNGILNRVMKKVGFTPNLKTRLKVASHILYENVADRLNYLEYFHAFNMPNTFNSWFLVTELHIWMLLVRSMAEGSESGEDGRFLRNSIVEVMWGDVNTRAKKLGASNPSQTRQQIEILSEQFQAALIAYDEGVMSDDKVLAAALWRRFFEMNCDDYEKIERLVKYVREQIYMLDRIPRDNFLIKPKIPWLPLDKITV